MTMLPWVAVWSAWVLLAASWTHVEAQGQDANANPWRQMIQWQNNGRTFSLLNSGAEYVPARAQDQDRGHRVLLADAAPHAERRPTGGNVRRQAPPRSGSETVRGQTRHPFGFGQVPDNWRQGVVGTGDTGSRLPSSPSRYRPSTGSSSSSSSSSFPQPPFSGPSYAQFPFPQQPSYPLPFDPSVGEGPGPGLGYEPPFQRGTGYSGGTGGGYGGGGGGYTGGGYGGGGYTGGGYNGGGYAGGGLGPLLPRSPTDYGDDSYRFYQPYGQPYLPAQPVQPQPDGLDRRYTHSLYNEDTSGPLPDASAPAAANPAAANPAAVPMDRMGPAVQPPVRSPQYEQFPPFRRVQPQPPLVPVQPGRNPQSPNSAGENQHVSVGSVYRPEQRGKIPGPQPTPVYTHTYMQ